ncbi:winged helix DNA-binding protein [Sphingopyxis sp.]|uniref:winged helix DNA-binding protein n=1 Tax=Sphingopyxis sp. TaxID=1908224 RepID=UPI003D80E45F
MRIATAAEAFLRDTGEGATPSSLVFVGGNALSPEVECVAGIRLAAHVPVAAAADHLRRMIDVDIVWLAQADAIAPDLFAGICAAVAAKQCHLLCDTGLADLDRLVAAVPASIRTEWLVDADAADHLAALAAAQRTRGMAVHDLARDSAMERIDRLQEEVARISRLLGDLSGQRGLSGSPPAFAPLIDDFDGYAGQVRSPTRDYAAIPRSFVPEERTIERQRAKQVRRILRQRRMREQYFPADLFADPAWDMLLDLYAARLERQPVSVSSLCIAAAVPATTALRWIKTMTDAGLFVREADPQDGRRIFIALAEGAGDAMARYFEALDE